MLVVVQLLKISPPRGLISLHVPPTVGESEICGEKERAEVLDGLAHTKTVI